MSGRSTLKEACFVFLLLAVLALFNTAQQWQERNVAVERTTWKIQVMLALDESQASAIRDIHYEYYDRLLGASCNPFAGGETFASQMKMFLEYRNAEIWNVLNNEQKNIWTAPRLEEKAERNGVNL